MFCVFSLCSNGAASEEIVIDDLFSHLPLKKSFVKQCGEEKIKEPLIIRLKKKLFNFEMNENIAEIASIGGGLVTTGTLWMFLVGGASCASCALPALGALPVAYYVFLKIFYPYTASGLYLHAKDVYEGIVCERDNDGLYGQFLNDKNTAYYYAEMKFGDQNIHHMKQQFNQRFKELNKAYSLLSKAKAKAGENINFVAECESLQGKIEAVTQKMFKQYQSVDQSPQYQVKLKAAKEEQEKRLKEREKARIRREERRERAQLRQLLGNLQNAQYKIEMPTSSFKSIG